MFSVPNLPVCLTEGSKWILRVHMIGNGKTNVCSCWGLLNFAIQGYEGVEACA